MKVLVIRKISIISERFIPYTYSVRYKVLNCSYLVVISCSVYLSKPQFNIQVYDARPFLTGPRNTCFHSALLLKFFNGSPVSRCLIFAHLVQKLTFQKDKALMSRILTMSAVTSAWTDQYLIFFPSCKHATLTLSLSLPFG